VVAGPRVANTSTCRHLHGRRGRVLHRLLSFPLVFVLIANALDNIRPSSKTRRRSSAPARRDTPARDPADDPPALLAGAPRLRPALTQFGTRRSSRCGRVFTSSRPRSGASSNYPPHEHLAAARRCPSWCDVLLLRGQQALLGRAVYGDRRAVERAQAGDARRVALPAFCARWRCCSPADLPAVFRADKNRAGEDPVRPLTFDNLSWRTSISFLSSFRRHARAVEHGAARRGNGDDRTVLALLVSYATRGGSGGYSRARLSRDGAGGDPGSCSGSGCSSATRTTGRALRDAVILLLAFSHRDAGRVPATPGGVSRAPSRARRGEAASLVRTGSNRCADHGAAVARQRRRDLVLCVYRRHPRIIGDDHAETANTKVVS